MEISGVALTIRAPEFFRNRWEVVKELFFFWKKKINTRTFLCVSCPRGHQPRGPSPPWGAVGDGAYHRLPAPVLDSP